MHELIPYDILVGRKENLLYLKVFRIIANVCIPNTNREKFDAKSEKCILIVFDESTSWYEPDSTPSDLIQEEWTANSDDDVRPSPL